MSTLNTISIDKLVRLIGTPACPSLIDVQTDEDFAAAPRLVPSAVRRPWAKAGDWAPEFDGRSAVVICQKGLKLSQGVAAWLRHAGVAAKGRTVWVTRARPKVDRIACPWLIRRFVDPQAVFLFVNPAEVPAVAERFGAVPFDIEGEGVFWSHRGELCTFDVMIDEFGLHTPAMDRLAMIVRGADTARPDLAPEAPGLLRSGCRGCLPRTCRSSKPACSSTTRSTAGAATRPARPTIGP
jgi:hypothetical protein